VVGVVLCLGAVALTIAFLWGLAAQAYWAVAIPIGVLVVGAMTLVFWAGWTFIVSDAFADDEPLPPVRRRPR